MREVEIGMKIEGLRIEWLKSIEGRQSGENLGEDSLV